MNQSFSLVDHHCHCNVSFMKGVTLCKASKICCSIVIIFAKGRKPSSTLYNANRNENVTRIIDCRQCYMMQFLLQLVVQQNCNTSCIV